MKSMENAKIFKACDDLEWKYEISITKAKMTWDYLYYYMWLREVK